MTSISETVVFFGSGPVAARSLELLSKYSSIEAVVTKPKPAEHKGDFPVLEVSKKLGLPTMTVSNKAELSELIVQKPFKSRLGVLVDFGIIVSQDVIDYFPLGIVNSHFSLLPRWRGADPISFAILNGDEETGVSLMLLVEKMDEGPLLAQARYPLSDKITTPELTKVLTELSNEMLLNILPLYLLGKTQSAPQTLVTIAASKDPTYSRKLTKEDGLINWHKPAEELEREIRAFIEWPKSRTRLGSVEIIITEARVVNAPLAPGQLQTPDKRLVVGTREKALEILKLKPTGKNEMTAQAFLAGYGKSL